MLPICPPANKLSLKYEHVKFSSRISACVNYFTFFKKILEHAQIKEECKEIYFTSIANWSDTSFAIGEAK